MTSVGGTFYVRDSASFGTCVSGSGSGNIAEMGQQNGGAAGTRLIPAFSGTIGVFMVNQSVQDTPANTSVAGLWHLTRTGASATTYYLSAATISTGTQASQAPVGFNFFIMAENVAGTPTNFTPNTHLGSFIGSGMNGTQVGNLRARMNTFAAAYGKAC
jgi:hypothetical protein